MIYSLTITRSNGERERHVLGAASQITVGADETADICLAGEPGLLPRHVLLAPQPQQCWVSVASGVPLLDEQQRPVESRYMPWGTRLRLGNCWFLLENSQFEQAAPSASNPDGDGDDKPDESARAPHPAILMFFVLTLALVGMQFLATPRGASSPSLRDAPALFDPRGGCTSEIPSHRAALAESAAFAKSDRSVFDLQDGVEAAALFGESAACYRQAGQGHEAEAMLAQERALHGSLTEEYKLLRLRLDRALQAHDDITAARHVRRLLQLLRHRSQSPYLHALRRLQLRLSSTQDLEI